jgi:O-antigen ligase
MLLLLRRPAWRRAAPAVAAAALLFVALTVYVRQIRSVREFLFLARITSVIDQSRSPLRKGHVLEAPAGRLLEMHVAHDFRIQSARNALLFFRDHPAFWLLGTGIGNYAFYAKLSDDYPFVQDAHSLYLQILIEMGMMGLAAFLILMTAGLRLLYRACRAAADTPWIPAAFHAGLIGLLTQSVLQNARLPLYGWVFLGLGVAICVRSDAIARPTSTQT